jgi:hypothetical protein
VKFPLAVLSLLVLLLSAQCSREPATPQNPILGRYALAGYDDSGQLIFTGEISFESLEWNHVKGKCVITRSKNAPEALYDKNGDCEGMIEGKKLDLDLAPMMDDGGILFEGEFDGSGRLTGDCLFDSFIGARRFGRFEAVKRT